jgi:hypothetical protein
LGPSTSPMTRSCPARMPWSRQCASSSDPTS